ncbi:MAG: protein kinase, partial [Patescibacteria group bacterium]|nr:protein kinase [Patescibacteria group bacterium]
MSLPNGTVVGKRYKIIEHIASSDMSNTYKAQEIKVHLGKIWLLKEFVPQGKDPNDIQDQARRFMRETDIQSKLNHPNVPKVDNFLDDNGILFFATEFIEGENVGNILRKNPQGLPETTVIPWMRTVFSVIYHLHTQTNPIIYRDCKPENLILDNDNKIWVIDFGIALEKSQTSVGPIVTYGPNAQTQAFGTPQTVSPQQLHSCDERSDIFNLGATFFWLLTGQPPCPQPFQAARDIYVIKPSISPWLAKIINKMLAYYPEDRYQSVAEIMAELPDNSQAKISKNSLPSLMILSSPIAQNPYLNPVGFCESFKSHIEILGNLWENAQYQLALKKIRQIIRKWYFLKIMYLCLKKNQLRPSNSNSNDDEQALLHFLHYRISLMLEGSISLEHIEEAAQLLSGCPYAKAKDQLVLAEVYEAQGKFRLAERQYQKIAEKTGDAMACKKLNEMQIKIEEQKQEKLAQKKQRVLARKQKLHQAITALQQQPAIVGAYLAKEFNPANSFNWFADHPLISILSVIMLMSVSFTYYNKKMSLAPDVSYP